jgi:integrase
MFFKDAMRDHLIAEDPTEFVEAVRSGETAQAGLREKTSHKAERGGRDARRERNPLTFHSLRRTATTLLHEAGIPAAVAQELIGHDSEAIHQTYINVGNEALKEAAESLAQIDLVQ